MSELQELYQELIIDHSKTPRNHGGLSHANRHAIGHNPLCGDKITVHAIIENEAIKDIRFEGIGCAISTASASLMTEMVKGKTETEANTLFDAFHTMITKSGTSSLSDKALLDKLVVLAGVAHFPTRVKCATLPWHTMQAALKTKQGYVTTE